MTAVVLTGNLCDAKPAHAFWKWRQSEIKAEPPASFYSKTDDYKVIFSFSQPPVSYQDDKKGKNRPLELNYKVAVLTRDPLMIFGNAPAVRVRFLDKDGFALVDDRIHPGKFKNGDCYGMLKVEQPLAKEIVSADIVPVKFQIQDLLDEKTPEPEPASPPGAEPVLENAEEKTPDLKGMRIYLERIGILWPLADSPILTSSDEGDSPLEPAIITNEAVTEKLAEMEKQPATEMLAPPGLQPLPSQAEEENAAE